MIHLKMNCGFIQGRKLVLKTCAKARCGEILPKGKANEHFNKLRICPQHSDD